MKYFQEYFLTSLWFYLHTMMINTLTIYKKNIKRKFQIEPSQPFYGSIFRQIEIEGWH